MGTLCGDFNAHHTLWGDKVTDARGKQIVSALDTEGLCVANDKQPTFFRPPASYSVIDLTLYSADILASSTTCKDRMGSDHFPVFVNIAGYRTNGRKSCPATHWDTYRDGLSESSGDLFADMLRSKKLATAELKLPDHFPAPDLKLKNLCAARRRAERRLMRTKGDPPMKTVYNRINAVIRRYTKKLRRDQWATFCASLSVFTPVPRIWWVVNNLAGNFRPNKPFEALALKLGKTLDCLANAFAHPSILF